MFLIKQVLPIVLLSMVIGFAVTWYNSRSSNPPSNEATTNVASNVTTGQAAQPQTARQPVPGKQGAGPAIARTEPRRPTVPLKVVKPPRSAPEPVQRAETVAKAPPQPKTPPPVTKPAPVRQAPPVRQPPPVVKTVAATQPVQTPGQKADPEFVNDIESLISELDSPAESVAKAPEPAKRASSKMDIPGWSADSFLDVVKAKKPQVVSPRDEAARVISQAARRSEKQATKDPYLNVLQDEATDLSVTAVDTASNSDIIRNISSKATVPVELAPYPDGSGDLLYTVKEGDSLTSIASDLLGDAAAYMQIYNANQDVLSSPDQVFKGARLRIPVR